jgi:hypothetical protein
LSVVLPKIQKFVLTFSTISIISGFILFGINTNYRYHELFFTFWGNVILISGILSLVVYFNIVSGGNVIAIIDKIKKSPKLTNQIPIVLFSMITTALLSMILISKAVVTR